MQLLVKTYVYESVTDEDTEDIDEELIDEKEEICTLWEVRNMICGAEPSIWPVKSPNDLSGHEWATVDTGQNWRNGEYGRESIFLYHTNGKPLKPHQLYRVWKIAGIAK